MNRQKRFNAAKADSLQKGSVFARLLAFGLVKLLVIMFALGIVFGLLSVHLIPLVVRAGMPALIADKLPYLGFACGALVGFSAAVSRAAMEALQIGLAIPLAVFALMGCVLSVALSWLWAIALLDVTLMAAAITAVFVFVIFGLNQLYRIAGSTGGTARKTGV